ncbi:unnamed protein product [Cuscuta europaea]|uniref:C2H2-type domain-containing protein n=1 Tax=Cuscuta europaea TaxID=41803 RepID=A0A9P0YTS1_CUSEU|nr:unnamed protein product [Cuscuta europaea]
MKRNAEGEDLETLAMANYLLLLANFGKPSSPPPPSDDVSSFQCNTCYKKFSSFQALGGHRASHKRPKLLAQGVEQVAGVSKKPKMHCCSICGLEFSMGQALGGHMRRHRAASMNGCLEKSTVEAVAASAAAVASVAALPVLKRTTSSKRVFGFELDLDLNLSPPENRDFIMFRSKTTPPTPVLRCFF